MKLVSLVVSLVENGFKAIKNKEMGFLCLCSQKFQKTELHSTFQSMLAIVSVEFWCYFSLFLFGISIRTPRRLSLRSWQRFFFAAPLLTRDPFYHSKPFPVNGKDKPSQLQFNTRHELVENFDFERYRLRGCSCLLHYLLQTTVP